MDRLKVLIADDELVVRQGISKIISQQEDQFQLISCAGNGQEALEILKREQIDILITDIRMPRLTGIELIGKIEQLGIELLVIIISAYNDTEYLKRAIKSQIVYDYVFKPFAMLEFSELLRLAGNFWRKRKQEIQNMKFFTSEHEGEDFVEIQKCQFRIMSYIKCSDVDGAIAQLRHEWRKTEVGDFGKCARMACELIMKIDWWLQGHGESKSNLFQLLSHMKTLEIKETPEDILEYIVDYIHKNCRNSQGCRHVTALVASCIELMGEHLSESEFSLASAADLLEVTPNYLSGRFSRDVGISFTKYLNLMRVERAKELLGDVTLRIYSISDMVGFKDARYFARIFREIVGMTPSEHRREILYREI